GPVRARRSPDCREGLLDGVLGAHPITEASQREAEDRPRVAVVELFEGACITPGHPLEQVAVTQPALFARGLVSRFAAGALGHGSGQSNADAHLLGISTGCHACWIGAENG